MPTCNLAAGDPLSLTLAADARLTDTDYTNDQIWELNLGGGEPAALALQTTYGLRAHWMRLFPRFLRLDSPRGESSRTEANRTDPAAFHSPPRITRFYANYLALSFEPYKGLEVLAEYWIPESQVAAGRIRLTNHSILPLNLRLEWVALLNPIERQGGMQAVAAGPTHVLAGETAYLYPVVFLTGGPQPGDGPYPSLAIELELYPGNARQFSWAAAALGSHEASLGAARSATARPWEAELARVELLNRSQTVEIQTGNADWDAALAFSQTAAVGLLLKNKLYLPEPSFVLSRRPDQGFSVRGGGSDYSHLWSGQTALDTYYLASLLLPGAPELAAGLVRNFLSVQEENGRVDWRPGLGGQRSRRLAQPMLATLAVQVGEALKTPDWYRDTFPGLLRFFNAWFAPACDQDGDGFPEWADPLQTGIEDSPIFNRWSTTAQGINIQCLEAPALAAMLLRECTSLIAMAESLVEQEKAATAYARLSGEPLPPSAAEEALPALRQRQTDLLAALGSTWDAPARLYHYRDYQTHLSPPGQLVAEINGAGKTTVRKRFSQARRLVIHLTVSEARTYAATFTLHGYSAEGEVSEVLPPRSFTWLGTQARATTQNTFVALKRVEVSGLNDRDQASLYTADYTQEDCSLFLPLWAGAASPGQAQQMIEHTLAERYLQTFGIPLCPPDCNPQVELPGLHTALTSALLPWNHLIGEGLLRYGYRAQAADLVTRLMNAVVNALKNGHSFRQYYQAESGAAAGDPGHLHGLAPVGLFLQTLGLRQISPKEIVLDGFNPFPGVIHVQYRKVQLSFSANQTEIEFPGGKRVTIDQPGPHRVTLA